MASKTSARRPAPPAPSPESGLAALTQARPIPLGDGAVLLVDEATGRPLHVLVPWSAYAVSSALPFTVAATRDAPPEPPVPPAAPPPPPTPKSPRPGGPLGRDRVDLLRGLIAASPKQDDARIARTFAAKTGRDLLPATIARHRAAMKAPSNPRTSPAEARSNGHGANGHKPGPAATRFVLDPKEYDGLVCHLAIKNGAPRHAVRDSEQFADGQLGLAEAARKFDTTRDNDFAKFAYRYIKGRIINGIRSRNGKVGSPKQKARRISLSTLAEGADETKELLIAARDEGPDVASREAVEWLLADLDPRARRLVERKVFEGMSFESLGNSEKPRIGRESARRIIYTALAEIRSKAKASR